MGEAEFLSPIRSTYKASHGKSVFKHCVENDFDLFNKSELDGCRTTCGAFR